MDKYINKTYLSFVSRIEMKIRLIDFEHEEVINYSCTACCFVP